MSGRQIWLALAIASFGWGTGGPGTRLAFEEGLEVYGLVVLRLAVAVVALSAYVLYKRGSLPTDLRSQPKMQPT